MSFAASAMEPATVPHPDAQPTPDQPPAEEIALEDEARFVTRLAVDITVETLRANNGNVRLDGARAVTQAIGLLQEAKRQIAAVRAGEITIKDEARPA